MYGKDVVLVLFFENPLSKSKSRKSRTVEKIFTRQDLFSKNETQISYGVVNHVTIDIVCKDNILLINTSEFVDVHLFDSLPVDKLVVITKGGCSLSSKNETLDNIDIDIKAGVIVLDTNIDNARSVKLTTEINPNGVVHVRKPINTSKLSIKTNAASLWSQVQTDQARLNGDLLKIESNGKLFIKPSSEGKQELNINIINAGTLAFVNSIVNGCKSIKLIPGSLTGLIKSKIFAEMLEELKDAKVVGENSQVILSTSGDIDGSIKVNNFLINTPDLLIKRNGIIESDDHLKLSGDNLAVYGQAAGKNTEIDVSQAFAAYNLASISGLESLQIKSLVTSLAAGVNLYGSTTAISCAAYINFGSAVRAYNFTLDCLLPLDFGITVPCLPHSRSDFLNINKAMTVGLMLVSNVYKPAALLANAGMSTFTIAQNLVKLFNSYSGKEAKAWQDQTWRDSLEQLLLLKRTLSTGVSLAQTAAPEQTQKVVNTISEACKPSINNTAVKTIVDSIASVNIAKTITDNVKHSLGDVIDTAENIATSINDASPVLLAEPISLIAPTINVQSVVDVNAGLNMSYSVNKQNLFSFNAGIVTGANVRNQTVFDQYNAGVYEANNLNLESSNHHNAGVEHAANKLTLNANNANITKSAEFRSDKETQVVINEEFNNEGSTSLANGTLQAKNLQQNGKFHTKNMSLEVDHLSHNGNWSYEGKLGIKSKNTESSLNSTITGADGSSCAVHSDTANMLGKEDHYSSVVDVKSMSNKEINDRINKTGKHSNKHVRHSLDLKTESREKLEFNSSGLDRNVTLGIQTAGDIECATQFNGQALSLKTTNGNIDVLKDINTVGDTVLEASGNINKSKTAIKSENSNVVLNAGGIVDNSNGGTISAKEGTASVTGSTVNNNCGAFGERSTIEAKLTFVDATDGNIENKGSTIKGSEFVSAVAKGDINNTDQELKRFHGENPYTHYQKAQIIGGTGNSETANVGAYVHANGKVNNIASEIGGAGRTIISGDQGVNMETKSNAYNDYDYKEKRGAVNKTYHKGQATEYGIATATGSKVDIISSEGGVTLHGAESIADDGTYIYAKKDVVLESHVSKEMHYTTEVKVKGLSRKKTEETTPTEKLNVIATNTGKMHVKSEEGKVIGTGHQFLGGGKVALLVEGKKGVELTRRVLNHRVVEKSRKVSINIAGQSLINNSKKSKMERLAAASPLINSADSLLKSNNPLEFAANANNLVGDASDLLTQAASEAGVAGVIKTHISAGVSVTKSKGITDYDIEGGGGSEGCSNVKFVAQEENVKIGNGYNGINKLEVEATKFIVANSELHSSTKYSEVSASASVDATGAQSYGASIAKSSSSAITQTQAVLKVKNLVLDVNEFELDGAKVTTDKIIGRADKITTRDKLNHEQSKSESQSVDVNSNVNLSNVKSESQTIGATGSLHVAEGINPEDFKIKEHENYGFIGITTDNPAKNKLFESGNVKQTQHDLHEFSKRSGGSIGFNAAQVKNPSKTGINGVLGIDHKNYKATVGENGRQINKNQKTDAKVRFTLPKESLAKNKESIQPKAIAPMIFSAKANHPGNNSEPSSSVVPEFLSASAKAYESKERVKLQRVINEPWKSEPQKPKTKLNKMPSKEKSEVEKKKPEYNVQAPKPEVKNRFALDPDDQETDFYDKPVQKDPQAIKQIFDHIVAAKDAVIDGYFGGGIRAYERISKEHDIKPDVTNMIYAGPGLARAALSVVPETPGELVFDVAMLVGAEPVAASGMWLYYCAKGGGVIKKTQPALVKFSQSSVNDWGTISDSMKKSGWKWSKKPVDIVKMNDGTLITLDNTRLLGAHEAGIELRAIIRNHDEVLKNKDAILRLSTDADGVPSTWGDAVRFRINKQNKNFKNTNPNGSHHTGLGVKYE